MMQDTCPNGASRAAPLARPLGGTMALGTLILAAASALFLVALSGCHSAPAANAFAPTDVDKSTEARLRRTDAMTPIQPFDEGFGAATLPP
jgi:hypothetical protein